MNPTAEHRLIRVRYDQLAKTQQKAGTTPVLAGTSARSAEANKKYQDAVHVKNLETGANATKKQVQTFIDPTTGQDTRQFDAQGQPIEGTGTFSTVDINHPIGMSTKSPLTGPVSSEAPTPDQFPGAQSPVKSTATTPPRATGKTLTGADLQAAASKRRDERLAGYGLTVDSELRQLFDQGAKYAGTENNRAVLEMPDGSRVYSPVNLSTTEQAAKAYDEITVDSEQRTIQEEQNAIAEREASQARAALSRESVVQNGALELALSQLPPELQGAAQGIRDLMRSYDESLQEQGIGAASLIEANEDSYQRQRGILQEMADRSLQTKNDIVQVLDVTRQANETNLEEQRVAEQARLEWDMAQEERELRRQKDADIEGRINELGFRGGFGSGKGVETIREAEANWETAISDLRTELGVRRTELNAKFSALWTQIQNDHSTELSTALNNFKNDRNALSLQSLEAEDKRSENEQTILQNLMNKVGELQVNKATALANLSLQVYGLVFQHRQAQQEESRWQYEQSWEEYRFGQEQDRLKEQFAITTAEKNDARMESQDTKEFQKAIQKVSSIRSAIESNKVMTPYRKDIQPLYENMKTAYESGNNAFSDRALAKIYEKMIEPNSVVMPGEYSDIASSAPLWSKFTGKFKKVLDGGQAWTSKEREQLFDLATQFHDTYKARYDEAAQQFYTDIDWFNSNLANPGNQITPEQVGLPSFSTTYQRDSLEKLAPPGLFPVAPSSGGGDASSSGAAILGLGRLTQGYSTPIDTTLYDQSTVSAWDGKHKGLDVAMPMNTRVPSPVSGKVVSVGYQGGWGNSVVIEDAAGALHRFSHLSSFGSGLAPGQQIERGQIIALSGGKPGTYGAGNSTGPHLDYRIKLGGEYLDPMTYHS